MRVSTTSPSSPADPKEPVSKESQPAAAVAAFTEQVARVAASSQSRAASPKGLEPSYGTATTQENGASEGTVDLSLRISGDAKGDDLKAAVLELDEFRCKYPPDSYSYQIQMSLLFSMQMAADFPIEWQRLQEAIRAFGSQGGNVAFGGTGQASIDYPETEIIIRINAQMRGTDSGQDGDPGSRLGGSSLVERPSARFLAE